MKTSNSFATLIFCLLPILLFAQDYKFGSTDKDMAGYLFVYFKGNAQKDEAICYAISRDGFNFKALNGNSPILDSEKISSSGGVRDPHILRAEDGKTFYMVATDMVTSKGWDSNRAFVMLKSTDLVNWTSSVVNIQTKYANQENLKRVWAPETIFDPAVGKYMVYWSMMYGNNADVIYYAYANKDFTDIEGTPKPLFIPKEKGSCIDGDIINKDGIFYLFYKYTTKESNGIRIAMTDSLTSGKWIEQPGYKEDTDESVEGSGVFKLNNSKNYILMYDMYRKGKYQFCESCDLDNFKSVDNDVSMNFHPRHGTVMPITRKEMQALTTKWGVPDEFEMPTEKNPILEGYYADPEILYSNKTKKYYIYPTSDGFDGWGGYYFKTFSSDNLKNWKDEGVILDLKKDVSWADKYAWAPCIIEKKMKGKYKYFFYFCGNQKIGVATSDSPTGPFVDSGKPFVDFKPNGVKGGLEIDPDVFEDPKTGKTYLYWGNGHMAVVELNKDMMSFDKSKIKIITPPDHTYREGTYVFYRKGKYYFMWSEDDTRSPNYKVRYGISDSPMGPIAIPKNNIVIQKDDAKGIFGTGHNSILQIPGTDEWYIVYHRISKPNGINMPNRAGGYHREVCMDKMEFNEKDGTIKEVKPSL